jgi:hypothetical protein
VAQSPALVQRYSRDWWFGFLLHGATLFELFATMTLAAILAVVAGYAPKLR